MVKGPIRRESSRRERALAENMIRFVADDAGNIAPDIEKKLPGRGLWLDASRDAVLLAQKKRIFSRELRRSVVVDDKLADLVQVLLERRCLQQLSLARRAGQLVVGFDQVIAELSGSPGGVLIMAPDAGSDARKLRHAGGGKAMVAAFSREELGQQVGRGGVAYAFISGGALAKRFILEARKLRGFRDFEMTIPDNSGSTNEGMSRAQ